MQSQYGFSEIQQFMVDGGYPSPFLSQPQKHHHHAHHQLEQQQQYHHHHQQPQQQQQHHHHQQLHLHQPHLQLPAQQPVSPAQMPTQPFQHFHTIPITQQLFEQSHQFQLFQQEQQRRMHLQHLHLGLDQDLGPRLNSGLPAPIISAVTAGGGAVGGGVPPFLGPINFKLGVNGSASGGGSQDGLKDDEDVLQRDEVSESRLGHPWSTGEEESAIKEPFWRPLDVNYINRDKEVCNEKEIMEPSNSGKHLKIISRDHVEDDNNGATNNNYKLFSELEAIYKPGSSGDSSGGAAAAAAGRSRFGGGNSNQQTSSISAFVCENPPTAAAADGDPNTDTADQGSNESAEEEAAKANKSSGSSRKRKRKQQLGSIAAFLEGLVRTLMEHQEGLQRRFLEVLERRDQERTLREETWRQQEAAKAGREAMARAQEQALASTREAAIISLLEKITGETLNVPTREQFHSDDITATTAGGCGDGDTSTDANKSEANNTSRWPKEEVEALIQVRVSLEERFQEPGLKGPLWEEVSSAMAVMGYRRSSKRCKEKWENINKSFRKSREGGARKRSQRSSKSTRSPYFHQLEQLYSRSLCATPPATAAAATTVITLERKEATNAVSVGLTVPLVGFTAIGTTRLVAANNQGAPGPQPGNVEKEDDGEEEEEECGEEEEEDEEGEGESRGKAGCRA